MKREARNVILPSSEEKQNPTSTGRRRFIDFYLRVSITWFSMPGVIEIERGVFFSLADREKNRAVQSFDGKHTHG